MIAKGNELDSSLCTAMVICPLKNSTAEQISSQEFSLSAVELSFDGVMLDRIRNCELVLPCMRRPNKFFVGHACRKTNAVPSKVILPLVLCS